MLFIGHDGGLSVFDDSTFSPATLPFSPAMPGAVYALAHMDGRLYVSGAGAVLRVYDTTTWAEVPTLLSPVSTERVYGLAVSSDQRYVAVAHFNRSVVYDLSTGAAIYNTSFFPHHAGVAFSAGDEYAIFTDNNSGASTKVAIPGGSASFGPSGLKVVALSPDRSSILALAFTSARELHPVTLDTTRTVSVFGIEPSASTAGVSWAENGNRAVVTGPSAFDKAVVIDAVTWTVVRTIDVDVGTTDTGPATLSAAGDTVVIVSPIAPYTWAFDVDTGAAIAAPAVAEPSHVSLFVGAGPPVDPSAFWTNLVRTQEVI